MNAKADQVRLPNFVTRPAPRRPSAPIRPQASVETPEAQPRPGEVGFVLQANAGDTAVCLMAWPLVSNTWSSLAQHWQALRAEREFSTAAAPLEGWMVALAPTLCAPFRDANSAESTIGAALARLPLGLAVGIGPSPLEAMTHCVDGYVAVAAEESRTPLRLIITDNATGQALWQPAIARSWRIDLLRGWHQEVSVKAWRDPEAPLPLQLCRLMAAAMARKIAEPSRWNPVYDGAEAKIRTLPVALKSLQRRGKKA